MKNPVGHPTPELAFIHQSNSLAEQSGRDTPFEVAQSRLNDPDSAVPCRTDPVGWDIDWSGRGSLQVAVRMCRLKCPLLTECRILAQSGKVRTQSMVWAGTAYDERGRTLDLDDPTLRVGKWASPQDTRLRDSNGHVFDGHTGRWITPSPTRKDTRAPS